MAQCRMAHNLPLHPQLMRDYCSIPDEYKYDYDKPTDGHAM